MLVVVVTGTTGWLQMCTAWRYSSAHLICAISLYAFKDAKEETINSIRCPRTEHKELKQLPGDARQMDPQDRIWKWIVILGCDGYRITLRKLKQSIIYISSEGMGKWEQRERHEKTWAMLLGHSDFSPTPNCSYRRLGRLKWISPPEMPNLAEIPINIPDNL